MGQKIHPLGLRLGISQPHRSKWCMKPKNYPYCILEDRRLRQAVIEIATERQEEALMDPKKTKKKKTSLNKNLSKQKSARGASTRGGTTRGASTRGNRVEINTNTTLKQSASNLTNTKSGSSKDNTKKRSTALTKGAKTGQKTKSQLRLDKPKPNVKTTATSLSQATLSASKLKPKAVVKTMFHSSMFQANLDEKKKISDEISDIFVNRLRTLHHYKTGEPLDVVEIYVHTKIPVRLIHGTNKKTFIKSVIDFQKALEKVGQAMRPENAPPLRVLLNVFQVPELSRKKADLIAAQLIKRLEERKPFRVALRETFDDVQYIKIGKQKIYAPIDGIKIQISGRLNGAEIARTECLRYGSLPLQTLRANVGYSYKTAKTTYGILGVKVWTFKRD